jgi:NAD(P) transhydrogenase subunit beta
MFVQHITGLSGLIAAVLFIFGLKRMSSPVTALSGIVTAGIGMVVAIAVSFLVLVDLPQAARPHLAANLALALVALLIGGAWAWWSGRKVAITAMPQMVALYNGMGGGAAAAVAAVELSNGPAGMLHLAVTAAGALIGSISLTGSLIAWAKLDGKIRKPLRFGGQRLFNGAVFLATVVLGILIVGIAGLSSSPAPIILFFAGALLFGILMTLPIGGADMPVVISIFNAFTGLAVGLEGYALQNPALMIAGMVVGSAGTLLTVLMAKAMNRSLTNVLFSNFGEEQSPGRGRSRAR